MNLNQGFSQKTNGLEAVAEATKDWNGSPDFVLAFCSTEQSPNDVAAALEQRFPESQVIGCTSTGEHLDGHVLRGSLVATGLQSTDIVWATALLPNLSSLSKEQVEDTVGKLFQSLGVDPDLMNPEELFCLSFVDGLSGKEETLSMILADALDGVPVIGGSAGDDMKFVDTRVIFGGKAYQDAAVLALAHTKLPYHLFKHQHFSKTPKSLAVTKADPDNRRVYELDGYTALQAYSACLGIPAEQINSEVYSCNPVVFSCNGEIYVRSIQQVHSDGSISFYCSVDEGMVLEIGQHEGIVDAFELQKTRFLEQFGRAEWMICCNCILRAVEAQQQGVHKVLEDKMAECSQKYIGFDTYGEQLNGLHINQTVVGLAIGSAT